MDVLGAILIILGIAVVPTIAYVTLIWWLDRYEKEPWSMLIAAFVWGSIPAIIAALILQLTIGGGEFLSSVLIAPVTEEFVKAILLFIFFLIFRREFDGILDGIIYGALVGAGFAMTENIFYYAGEFFSSNGSVGAVAGLAFLRGIIFGLNHSLFTSVTGAALGAVRYTPGIRQVVLPFFGLTGAITLHMIHNGAVSVGEGTGVCVGLLAALVSDWGGLLVIVVIAIMALRREQKWIQNELAEEVGYGIINAADLRNTASWRRRWSIGMRIFQKSGFGTYRQYRQLYQLLTELAFKKHQYRTLGEERGNLAEIQRLRGQISSLRQRLNMPV